MNDNPTAGAPSERQRFEKFLKEFTFEWECVRDSQGRVIAEDEPGDLGGVTKYGIDRSAHQNLSADEIRNLTEDQAVEIYFTGEWPTSHANQLAFPLGEIAFDMTILDGPGRAIRALQTACGFTGDDVDGGWGPNTLGAATKIAEDPDELMRAADRMLKWRAARYHSLVEKNPKQGKFLKGWLNRTNALRDFLKVPDVA